LIQQKVKQLVNEGYEDTFMVRRALAFADNNIEDARAILLAEKLDQEEEERSARQQASLEPEPMKTVTVDANFDPATIGVTPSPAKAPAPASAPDAMPPPAKKQEVVFEATTAQIQELVIESPVPVLLDIHAEW
jgi:hypothetical protein